MHDRHVVGRGAHGLDHLIAPMTSCLVPIFFGLMGIRTDVGVFGRPGVLGLAAALTAVAIVGKQSARSACPAAGSTGCRWASA